MPRSEFNQATKRKLESTQSKMTNYSSDLSSLMPDQEFVELLWENGQIVMQGQSNRPRKSSLPTVFPSSHTTKVQEKDSRDAIFSRIGRYGAMDSVVNDFAEAGSSGQTGLGGHDDEIVPWLNYPVDDYSSEFLSELSGVNLNSLSTHNGTLPPTVPTDRSNTFILAGRDSHNLESGNASKALTGGFEHPRTRNSQLFQLPQPCNSFVPNGRLRALDFSTGNSTTTHPSPCGDLPNTKMQEQDLTSSMPLPPSTSTGLMNFSHFSRPVALVKANLQNVDRLRSNEKASTAASSFPMESTVIESLSGLKSGYGTRGQLASGPASAKLKKYVQPPQEAVTVEHSEAICQEDASRNDNINTKTTPDCTNCQSSSFTASMTVERQETEKGPEPVVASSSVCSGNGAGAASNYPKHGAKRKTQEGEECGYQSEGIEDESEGLKKPATGRGMGTKRSRAAEVHNLSERRRRDRINEKMRALQELIPNCNKADKASMLDEAIEYLKTLQLQVQIMSMGSGLCMPPMMLPAGMQHLRAPHMAHFSPMGVGMGMGMGLGLGFGMGMLDMSGSAGCPMIPMPPMHRPHFPCSSIPGNPGLQGVPASASLQMFGIPGQGLPMSMPHGPPFAPVLGLPTKVNSVPEISGTATSMVQAMDPAPSSTSKDQQIQNIETTTKTSADGSRI